MKVNIQEENGKALVKLEGRLDTTNADQFMKDIKPLMDGTQQEIDVDCTDMEYTSSQGLRMFLMLQKNVSARGAKLVLRNMKPAMISAYALAAMAVIAEGNRVEAPRSEEEQGPVDEGLEEQTAKKPQGN